MLDISNAESDKKCESCGSSQTFIRSTGHPMWLRIFDNVRGALTVCNRCYMDHQRKAKMEMRKATSAENRQRLEDQHKRGDERRAAIAAREVKREKQKEYIALRSKNRF